MRVRLILLILDNLNIIQAKHVISYLTSIDFKVLIMDFILALLLFAGSIQLRIPCLRKEKDPILLLSTLGVVISAFLFGSIFYVLAQLIGLQLPFLLAILVGIIVSPTDPIIILNLLLKSKTPKLYISPLDNSSLGIFLYLVFIK